LTSRSRRNALLRLTAQLAVVVALLCLAAANIYVRATWSEAEDGVLWSAGPSGLVAQEVAPGSPAARAHLRAGDILEAIDGRPVDRPADVIQALHKASSGQSLTYTVLRTQTPELLTVAGGAIPPSATGM
jgi:S1-C subfamily serine protease